MQRALENGLGEKMNLFKKLKSFYKFGRSSMLKASSAECMQVAWVL